MLYLLYKLFVFLAWSGTIFLGTEIEQLMTVPEFARVLGVTQACIRRWILGRQIARVKVGRCVRIPISEAKRIIAAGFRPAIQRNGGQK
jgi:excisionase family DNA binding protein